VVTVAVRVEEAGAYHTTVDVVGVHRAEVLLGRQVDEGVGPRRRGEVLVEHSRDVAAPELVERATAPGRQVRAHLEPVGLHQVERAQHPVQARQDPHRLLGLGEVTLPERRGLHALVDVAVERQHRRTRVVPVERRREVGEPLGVELGELGGDVHQRRQLVG